MRKRNLLALGSLLATFGLVFGTASSARSQKPAGPETLTQRLARLSKLPEADVALVWEKVGVALKEDLLHGQQVQIPGLGTMHIVRIQDHKDLKDGRPVTIAGTNTVEFLADGELTSAVNGKGVEPVETVPEFRFRVFPDSTPGQKTPTVRNPGQRIRQ